MFAGKLQIERVRYLDKRKCFEDLLKNYFYSDSLDRKVTQYQYMSKEQIQILIPDGDQQSAQKLSDLLQQAGYQSKIITDKKNFPEAIETSIKEHKKEVLLLAETSSFNNAQEPSNGGLLLAKNFSEYVSASPNIKDILQHLVDDVVKNLGYEICAVILRREDNPDFIYMASVCGISIEHREKFNLRVGEGVTGKVVEAGEPRVVPNILGEEDYSYPEIAIRENFCSMVSIPLRYHQKIFGALNVYTGNGYFHVFKQDEINLLTLLANWTAFAIHNAEKYETKEREQKRLIEEIIRETQSTASLKKMIRTVLQKSADLVGGDAGYIAFVDFEHMRFRPVFGHRRKVDNIRKFKIGTDNEGITGYVVRCGQAEIIDDVYKYPKYQTKINQRIKSKLLVPLKYQDQVIGVLSIDSGRETHFKQEDRRILEVLASQLALTLLKKIFDQAFRKLAYSFKTSHDVNEIYDIIVKRASEVTRSNAVVLWEKDSNGDFQIRSSLGFEEYKTLGIKIHSNKGIISQVIAKGDAVLVQDVKENQSYVFREMIASTELKWLLCVPMFFGNEMFAVLDIYTKRPHGFFEQEVDSLKALASQAGVAIENAKLIDHFNRIAQAITSSQGIKPTLESIAKSAMEVLFADPVTLFQYDQGTKRLVPPPIYAGNLLEESGYVETFVFSGRTFAELIVAAGESIYIEEDIDQHPLMLKARENVVAGMPERRFHKREKIKSLAAIILRVEKEIVGLMFLNYRTPQKFSSTEKKMMETFASYAAIAIKNSRLIEQLRNNEEFMEGIIEKIPDPIIVTENQESPAGPVWKIKVANRIAHEMFGYDFTTRELVGNNSRALFGVELGRVRNALREAGGEISYIETSFLHKGGYSIPISLSTSVLQRDPSGRIIETIGIAKDLTHRKQLERQLDHLNRATISLLGASTLDQAFDSIFENLHQLGYDKGMISLADRSSNSLVPQRAVGENWKKMASLSKGELSGNEILSFVYKNREPVLIEDCESDSRCNRTAMRITNIKSQYITPLIAQDKVIGTLQIDLSNKQDLLSGDKYFLTESLKILSGFANQIAVAIEANRRNIAIDKLRRTLADVGHEFRSPLHIIITQLGGLQYHLNKHYEDDKQVERTAKIVEEEAYRAARQMYNALFSTAESFEAMGANFEETGIGETITVCAERFYETAGKRGIKILVFDSVRKLPPILCDKALLEQLFTNLIDNAVKYSHAKQNIEIRGMLIGRKIEISIMDRGLGIPENQHELIFQGFTRSDVKDRTRFIPGTGLGLMIAREIVERHCGKIKVKSIPFMSDPMRIMNYDGFETAFLVQLPQNPREG